MNKKLVSIVMSVATLLSGAAFAECDPQYYVGGEVSATKLGKADKKIDKNLHKKLKTRVGGGAFVGSRFNENLGVEAGYTFLGKKSVKNKARGLTNKSTLQTAYVDMMGYLPLDCSTDLIGSVGVGYLKSNAKATERTLSNNTDTTDTTGSTNNSTVTPKRSHKNRNSAGVRLGVGAQYKFTENVGARVMVNYQPTRGDVKHMTTAKVGMFYQF